MVDGVTTEESASRGQWASRLGFVLAAAGSAVGLGNVWKFPYITGENGGGLFVLIYLGCVALIGLPVMIAEVIIGRRAQRSPVGAFGKIAGEGTAWRMVGWMGVVSGFVILSYYSVVAGWTMNYALMGINRFFVGKNPDQIGQAFGTLYGAGDINLFWHFLFMLTTIAIVVGGVQKGIEAWSRVLMPALFAMLLVLLVDAAFQPGFSKALSFLFSPHADKLHPAGVLEALGHSFFTLSLGMGAMLTYGSYLSKDTDLVTASLLVSVLDTAVALVACMVLFPIIFSFGMAPEAGPGLVFKSMPIAFSQMRGGMLLTIVFFALLFFAALTSAISLLEVVASTIIDQLGWSRRRAVLVSGGAIFVFGIPSALSGGAQMFKKWESLFGKNFFDTVDYLASNWLLPLGGLFIALFVGWVMPEAERADEFKRGSRFAGLYQVWLLSLRYLVPLAILVLWLFSVEILPKAWLSPAK
ncbi:MAG: sodium-dependent transporter [Myxococcales bacterium]|nr:sodium-dependent transporter [Myxococcales bacterium]MCB9576835.1 sodium-dependent transporter [Polyangiaceae bacterium]